MSFLIAPTGYIVKIALSDVLALGDYGLLYVIISFVTILSAYNDLGMTESVNYFFPKSKHPVHKSQILVNALGMQMFTSLILGVMLWFVSDWLAVHYFSSEAATDVLRIFIAFFFLENLFKTLTTLLQALHQPGWQKMCEFVRMLTLVIYVVLLFLTDATDLLIYCWGWIIALIVGNIFAGTLILQKYAKTFGKWSWDRGFFVQMLRYALMVVLTTNAAMLLSQIDMQMVAYMLGQIQQGTIRTISRSCASHFFFCCRVSCICSQ